MGKLLRPLAFIAAIALQFIPGVGQILGSVLGSFLFAATTAALLAYANSGGGRNLAQSQLSRLSLSFNPETPRKIVFGETAFATDVIYQEASGDDQEFISLVIACAAHEVHSFDTIWTEDKPLWSSGSGLGAEFADYALIVTQTKGTRLNGLTINDGARWNHDCTLTGCAYLFIRIKRTGVDSKVESPFSAGLKPRMTIIGKGAKVYDPRRDTTVGGSGSHRADNQATWQYLDGGTTLGTNPALQALSYMLGYKEGGVVSVGIGIPPVRLAMADWIAAANICDEAISLSGGGTQKRYETSGIFTDDDDPREVLAAICVHMNATLRDTGGKIGIRMAVNDFGGTLLEFTEDDVLGSHNWEPFSSLSAGYNIVRGRWVDPSTASLFQQVPYPAQSVASEDGVNRPLPLDLPLIQDATRAQRVARQVLMRGQFAGTFTADFGPRAWACEVGQPVRFTFPAIGAVSKLFRVIAQEIKIVNSGEDAASFCTMTLQEDDASIYAWTGTDAQPVPAAIAAVSYLPSNSPILLGVTEAAGTAIWSGVTGPGTPEDGATRNVVTYSATAPASPVDGDLWVDTSGTFAVFKLRSGATWQVGANALSAYTALSGRPVALADINTTESSKLAGIAPGADVTSANTSANSNALGGTAAATVASNITTAGTTATWTGVTGTGRPADNATRNLVTYSATEPASPVNGDLWVDTSGTFAVFKLRSGATWQVGANALSAYTALSGRPVALADINTTESSKLAGIAPGADVTSANTPSMVVPGDQEVAANAAGTPLTGQLPRNLNATRTKGGTSVTASTTWSLELVNLSATINSSGVINITALAAKIGYCTVVSARDGITLKSVFAVRRIDALPGGTSADGKYNSSSVFILETIPASHTPITNPMTVVAGAAGQVALTAALTFYASVGNEYTTFYGKWQWKTTVGGSWADVSAEVLSQTGASYGGTGSEADPYYENQGAINITQTKTGLTNGASYDFRISARDWDGMAYNIVGLYSGTGT